MLLIRKKEKQTFACPSLLAPVTMKGAITTWEECVKLLHSHYFFLLPKSAAPGPALSIRTPATLAARVVTQHQPCWYSNTSVTVMKWILPKRKTICQTLTQKVQILLWRSVYSVIGTMRSIRKWQTFVLLFCNRLLWLTVVYFFLRNRTLLSWSHISCCLWPDYVTCLYDRW